MSFSQNLSSLKQEKGVSNYRLSKELQVHPTTIRNWLDGKVPILEHAKKVSDYFGKTIEEMMK